MNATMLRLATLAAACALALAGCATTREELADEPVQATEPEVAITESESESSPRPAPALTAPSAGTDDLSDPLVGVQACDDYLSSYRACHRVIGTYDTVTLERRFEELRNTLVRQSKDPAIAPDLEARCVGLVVQRDEALRGRECDLVTDADDDDNGLFDGDDD